MSGRPIKRTLRGRTRPIWISALEDKIVQSAVRHVLEAIYEQDCLDGCVAPVADGGW